jgi:hypothetical protein
MLTHFTITVTTTISGEEYSFQRSLPLSYEMARNLAGEEVKMILSRYYEILQAANMISGNTETEE